MNWFHTPQSYYEWQRHIWRELMDLPQRRIYRAKVRPRGQGETNREAPEQEFLDTIWEIR
jgi:hypothetical protein